jgi:sialic acid synthase SpsE
MDYVCDGPWNVIMSTGMSYPWEIDEAVRYLVDFRDAILHCTSSYPCPLEDVNLLHLETLRFAYENFVIGYSGHETGLAPTLAAVAMGADIIERHITLDRAIWGTDQAASVEPTGFARLVKDIRAIEEAMGDGIKYVTDEEKRMRKKLRGDDDEPVAVH